MLQNVPFERVSEQRLDDSFPGIVVKDCQDRRVLKTSDGGYVSDCQLMDGVEMQQVNPLRQAVLIRPRDNWHLWKQVLALLLLQNSQIVLCFFEDFELFWIKLADVSKSLVK